MELEWRRPGSATGPGSKAPTPQPSRSHRQPCCGNGVCRATALRPEERDSLQLKQGPGQGELWRQGNGRGGVLQRLDRAGSHGTPHSCDVSRFVSSWLSGALANVNRAASLRTNKSRELGKKNRGKE